LPADVWEYFGLHDGQSETSLAFIGDENEFLLLSVQGAIHEWNHLKRLMDSGDFDSGWFDAAWLPVTTNGAGDCHCVDMPPAGAGRIILFNHEVGNRPTVAESLAQWLRDIAQVIEAQ